MDVYILDALYKRVGVVDNYVSLIWTERFSAAGDFELLVVSNLENRKRFVSDVKLAIPDSVRVMIIDTVEDSIDNEGVALLKVKGFSLEWIMESRLARGSSADLTTEPKWTLSGPPKNLAEILFNYICVLGLLDPGDVIPLIDDETSTFPADTIEAPPDDITYEIDPKTLYAATKELCDLFNMGFRLYRDDNGQLYYNIYMGNDRTTRQTSLDAVVFSRAMDNLQNTTELNTTAAYRNVAYVLSPVGVETVYGTDVDPLINGFDRRVLIVKADDITDVDPVVATAKMVRRGSQELGKTRRFSGFDGELSQSSKYIYGKDYNLGDLVELRNDDGATTSMQVTEQIIVGDKEGKRSYPTLSVNLFVMPGTWLAAPPDKVWADGGATEYWADSP